MQLRVKYFTAVVFIVLFVACSNNKSNSTASSFDSSSIIKQTAADTSTPLQEDIHTDSLPARQIGEMVLNGTLIPSDNKFTFRLMDSLQAKSKEDRRFYFSVFNKIMDRADGALGEAIGDYLVTYVEQSPAEFIEFSKDLTEERFETWASNVGIELSLSANDSKKAYEDFADLVTNNCKSCNTATLNKLRQFNKVVLRTLNENSEDQPRSE